MGRRLTAAHHESTDRLHNIEKFEDNMFRLYSEQKVVRSPFDSIPFRSNVLYTI